MIGIDLFHSRGNVPIDELLPKINRPSMEFMAWARIVSREEMEWITDALILGGKVNDELEALEFLNDLSKRDLGRQFSGVALCDLGGKRHNRPFKLLRERVDAVDGSSSSIASPHFAHGRIGHQAIREILTGSIPDFNRAQSFIRENLGNSQRLLYPQPPISFWHAILPNNFVNEKLIIAIQEVLKQIQKEMQETTSWFEIYCKIKPLIYELSSRMAPIFGVHFDSLRGLHDGMEDAYLEFLFFMTLLSWASIVPSINQPRKHLFSEIKALDRKLTVGCGVIDEIEVKSINGRKPNRIEGQLLSWAAKNVRDLSAGELIYFLERKLGRSAIDSQIIDWKFAVGDGGPNRIIKPSDVLEPLPRHVEQVRRYIAAANFGYMMACGHEGRLDWRRGNVINSGTITYILPTSEPITHNIELSPDEQRREFDERIFRNLPRGRANSVFRRLSNLFCAEALDAVKLSNRRSIEIKRKNKPNKNRSETKLLFPDRQMVFAKIAEQSRKFADRDRIVEVVGVTKKGKDVYQMDLDRLVEFLGNPKKKRVVGDFNLSTGKGFICCLMPGHDDSTPSMHVDLNIGRFYCFGCHKNGGLTSVKPDIVVVLGQVSTGKGVHPQFNKTRKVEIPPRHHAIMSTARNIMRDRFRGSPAENYCIQRSIDPDLAFAENVGYADDTLINSLLDAGYSYEELIFYGFIGISGKIGPTSRLCKLLTRRGLEIKNIRREIKAKSGEQKFGFPYPTLSGRVTFPLGIEGGKVTNIYGRDIRGGNKKFRHRKLTTKNTGVPHGAFNMDVLAVNEYPEVFIAEGTFDALSLMMMGHGPAVAIIGTLNHVLLEAIARSDKDVALALDHDNNKSGQEAAIETIDKLKAIKFGGNVRNYTTEFVETHPEFVECGDFNEWWSKYGSKAN